MGAAAPLWYLNAQGRETAARLRAALAAYQPSDRWRARALMHLAEFEDDIPRLQESLALWREIGDREAEAEALESVGWAHDAHGNVEDAQKAHEESLALRHEIGSPEVRGLSARAGLCHCLVASGATEDAERVARELLGIARRHDAVRMEELALHFLADCSLLDGDYTETQRRYRDALALADRAGLLGRATDEVIGIAMGLAASGERDRAHRIASAARAQQAELGMTPDEWWRRQQERFLGALQVDPNTVVPFATIVDELLAPEVA
jgi:tetratricopeptide (TPR) repeat protein